jgi:hypothetical protein
MAQAAQCREDLDPFIFSRALVAGPGEGGGGREDAAAWAVGVME